MARSHTISRPYCLFPLLLLGGALLLPQTVYGQRAKAKKADDNTVTGKLVEVKQSGRDTTLTIETGENETKDFQITSRTDVEITAVGDAGFLKEGQFVSSMPILTNQKLFASTLTVHIGPGRKVGKLAKAPKKAGVSKAAYLLSGQIMSRANDKQYPDIEVLTLRVGRRTVPVYLDKGYSVTVNLANPEQLKPGSTVTIAGKPGRRDRFTVTSVKVKLAEPLKAETFFADDKSPGKKPRATGGKETTAKGN